MGAGFGEGGPIWVSSVGAKGPWVPTRPTVKATGREGQRFLGGTKVVPSKTGVTVLVRRPSVLRPTTTLHPSKTKTEFRERISFKMLLVCHNYIPRTSLKQTYVSWACQVGCNLFLIEIQCIFLCGPTCNFSRFHYSEGAPNRYSHWPCKMFSFLTLMKMKLSKF